MKKKLLRTLALVLLLANSVCSFSQSRDEDSVSTEPTRGEKSFKIGFFVGVYFANQYTANAYDGYGFDIDGNKYDFTNSFMNNKINIQYGGGYNGQPDLIAQALGVNHGDWTFNESDMPTNMRYNPAFLVGLQMRYSVDKKNAILFNINASKLIVNGNFTISIIPASGSTQINSAIKTFAIKGGEQRLLFQLGYQRILGDNERLNGLIEGGMNVTISKFDKNEILINGLAIDLTSYYNYAGNAAPLTKKPIGTGLGAFAGIGANVSASPKFTVQFMYNPSLEKIRIGENQRLKLQHAVGLRAYYNF